MYAARQRVLSEGIPRAVAQLEETPGEDVAAVLHRHGVCCYYLCAVARACQAAGASRARKAVHCELVARCPGRPFPGQHTSLLHFRRK
jgi:hypothetical protein